MLLSRRECARAQPLFADFGVTQFFQNVNNLRVTWVGGVTSGRPEARALNPAKPNPIDVYYVSDMTPVNADVCGRSLGDCACAAEPDPLLSIERFNHPRTLNHHSMLGACATNESIDIRLLYMGSAGSHFSLHVEDLLLHSVSHLQF